MDHSNSQQMAVIADPKHFDDSSGGLLERMIFNHRQWIILACLLLTAFFAFQLRHLVISASYEKMLPGNSPYIQNFLENRDQLNGLGDSVRVVVENPKGDIFNKEYLNTLAKINDELFLLNGVDRV